MVMMRVNYLGFAVFVLLGFVLISGFSFAEKPVFDETNSCFCKPDQDAIVDILCNVEKTVFYFFNTSLDCSTIDLDSITEKSCGVACDYINDYKNPGNYWENNCLDAKKQEIKDLGIKASDVLYVFGSDTENITFNNKKFSPSGCVYLLDIEGTQTNGFEIVDDSGLVLYNANNTKIADYPINKPNNCGSNLGSSCYLRGNDVMDDDGKVVDNPNFSDYITISNQNKYFSGKNCNGCMWILDSDGKIKTAADSGKKVFVRYLEVADGSGFLGSSEASVNYGHASGDGGKGSAGKSTTKESGTKKSGEVCTSSIDCESPLTCIISDKEGKYVDVLTKGTKVKSGQKATCQTLTTNRLNKPCQYQKECPFSFAENNLYYCNLENNLCAQSTAPLTRLCIPELSVNNVITGNYCLLKINDETLIYIDDYVCGLEPTNKRNSCYKEFSKNDADGCAVDEECKSKVCSLGNCVQKGAGPMGGACSTNDACKSGLCKNSKCVDCKSNADCSTGKFCATETIFDSIVKKDLTFTFCKSKAKASEACVKNEDCISGICNLTSKTCTGTLHEEGCISNNDCSGDLICDTTLKICKEASESTICTAKGAADVGCPENYFCAKNNVFVNNGVGTGCLEKARLNNGEACYSSNDCKSKVCVSGNKKISNQFDDSTNYLFTFGKGWSNVAANPTPGVCGQIKQGGFCEWAADCEAGLGCISSVCSAGSLIGGKLSLLTPCNYDVDCESGFCTKIGDKQICTVAALNNLYISGNKFQSSYGLVSKTNFSGSVFDSAWNKYEPNCNNALKLINTEYNTDELCKYMFGSNYPYCLSTGLCSKKNEADVEADKKNAAIASLKNTTVGYKFELTCTQPAGWVTDEENTIEVPICELGVDKTHCTKTITISKNYDCSIFGMTVFDQACIRFGNGSYNCYDFTKWYNTFGVKINKEDSKITNSSEGYDCWISAGSQEPQNNYDKTRLTMDITCSKT